jgi:glycosyltransferase involved in cell wall biosynthesis
LIVAGTGSFLVECKTLAKNLKIKNCVFLGYITDQAKYNLYELSDIFVLPSTFRDGICEAWGFVLNEAMSFKKPLISTDAVAGAYDLIKNGENGYIVGSGDSIQLQNCISRLISDSDLILRMGAKSIDMISSDFTIEKMVNGFKTAIDWSINNK